MNLKTVAMLVLILKLCSISAAELRFNEQGKMLAPDQIYLDQGIESQGRGHKNDAMRHFKKSARFGNPYAQSAIAFMHMQNEDYVSALAWFNLVDLKMIDKGELISTLISELDTHMTESSRLQLKQLYDQLVAEFGKEASLIHREDWKKSIAFGGSKIKGHVPGRVKIYSAGRIEQRGFGEAEIFVSAAFVTGESVRLQLKEFIYEYEYKFTHGKVSLGDLEMIDQETPI
jgi:hypothetical protein